MGSEPACPPRPAEVLAEAIGRLGASTEPKTVRDHLELIRVAAGVDAEARSLLQQAVSSARSAGATWSAVGSTLGMTKQAAQKRFTAPAPTTSGLDPDERILGPVTVFDEMAELALAGRYGWHSVEAGPSFHRVVRSATQWEHLRVSMLIARATLLQGEGWRLVGSRFPYTYLARDLATPALPESAPERPVSADAGPR